ELGRDLGHSAGRVGDQPSAKGRAPEMYRSVEAEPRDRAAVHTHAGDALGHPCRLNFCWIVRVADRELAWWDSSIQSCLCHVDELVRQETPSVRSIRAVAAGAEHDVMPPV